jgi:hypothetical protein
MFLFLPEVMKIKEWLLKGIIEEFTSHIYAVMLQMQMPNGFELSILLIT